MPHRLKALFPDAEVLLGLPPEELGGVLLSILRNDRPPLSLHNFVNNLYQTQLIYPVDYKDRVGEAIAEAWNWLLSVGLLAPHPRQGAGWYFITKRGWEAATPEAFESYRKASLIPRDLLHPIVTTKAWPNFLRGDYDTAVFQAFKEVEVEVRKAGNYENTKIGKDLMLAAFHESTGPLTDQTLPVSERQATAFLFAGAIGRYKNPGSHRTVVIDEATRAAEMLILASHLLHLVDERIADQQSDE
ncbi:TIGR02391 family protein (plasmid) [Skermanella sp. TT6]|uniref:TIGR02391 family protein n=1 Tax=Skermanella cutis TaxID=2775420 RepID=A0ABX7BJZ4_9PROT|nr:TIGR02391 family protein [Skermanella sp. TT6]QQP94011.1 TIGR02391 family protein [Skermanella sp. TT6]